MDMYEKIFRKWKQSETDGASESDLALRRLEVAMDRGYEIEDHFRVYERAKEFLKWNFPQKDTPEGRVFYGERNGFSSKEARRIFGRLQDKLLENAEYRTRFALTQQKRKNELLEKLDRREEYAVLCTGKRDLPGLCGDEFNEIEKGFEESLFCKDLATTNVSVYGSGGKKASLNGDDFEMRLKRSMVYVDDRNIFRKAGEKVRSFFSGFMKRAYSS